ncbi:MAG TPA: hypothetical protein VGO40_14235 [Longimicrobium sp.]|jgi:hypothetical protein|nr:hypothetical protein [Longimicrobium sp.]
MTDTSPSAGYRPRSRLAQGIVGLFIAALGGWLTWLAWHQTLRDAEFSLRASFLGPAFVVLGLGLAAFGGYREERLARGDGLEGLQGFRVLTPRWWGLLALAFASAAAYTVALWQGWIAR